MRLADADRPTLPAGDAVVRELRDLRTLVKIAILQARASNPEPVTENDILRVLAPELDALKSRLMTIVGRVERENADLRGHLDLLERIDERREERRARQVEQDAAWAHENPNPQATELPVRGYYVYVLWGGATPIYVGSSRNVLGRMGQHLADRAKAHLITRITVKQYRDEVRMLDAESMLIARYRPRFNVIGIDRSWVPNAVAVAID